MYDANMNFIHKLADILIIQSIARRWIAMKLLRPHQNSKRLGATNYVLMESFRDEPYNRLLLDENKTFQEMKIKVKDSKKYVSRQKIFHDEGYLSPTISVPRSHPRRVHISRSQLGSKSHQKDNN